MKRSTAWAKVLHQLSPIQTSKTGRGIEFANKTKRLTRIQSNEMIGEKSIALELMEEMKKLNERIGRMEENLGFLSSHEH